MSTVFIPKTEQQEQTYKVEDVIMIDKSFFNPYIICLTGQNQVAAFSLRSGLKSANPVTVKDYANITEDEMTKITANHYFRKIEIEIREV